MTTAEWNRSMDRIGDALAAQVRADTEAREFQVPVVVTVCVTVAPDGTPTITAAYPDLDGAPWAYSGDPAAYEPETEEGGTWHEGRADDAEPYIVAWNAAIDGITVTPTEATEA